MINKDDLENTANKIVEETNRSSKHYFQISTLMTFLAIGVALAFLPAHYKIGNIPILVFGGVISVLSLWGLIVADVEYHPERYHLNIVRIQTGFIIIGVIGLPVTRQFVSDPILSVVLVLISLASIIFGLYSFLLLSRRSKKKKDKNA